MIALQKVYDDAMMRWAIERAMYANVNFRRDEDPPFIPEDFLGRSNRQERIAQSVRDRMEMMRMNTRLAQITKHTPPESVPAWARGRKN